MLRVDVCGYSFYVEPVASAKAAGAAQADGHADEAQVREAHCSDGMHLNKHQPGLRGRAKSRT